MNHQKKRVAFESDLEVLYLYLNVRAGWIIVSIYVKLPLNKARKEIFMPFT